MRLLPRFWKSLDEVPGTATDRRDWVHRLGDELPWVETFLRPTGHLAKQIECPSPGSDECPRSVIELPSGRYRAVCGNNPAECDAIDVTRDDISILALDRRALAAEIARCLDVPLDYSEDRRLVLHLGRYNVAAGVGFRVVLVLPHPHLESLAEQPPVRDLSEPTAILLPTTNTMSNEDLRRLRDRRHAVLSLDEFLAADGHGVLSARLLPDALFESLRAVAQSVDRQTGRVWLLPTDARWAEVLLEVTATEMVAVTFRGRTRRFGPDELALRDKRSGKPKLAWRILVSLLHKRGVLGWPGTTRPERYQKRKQELSKALVRAFGIGQEPIPWSARDQAYVAQFVAKDGLPKNVADDLSSRALA